MLRETASLHFVLLRQGFLLPSSSHSSDPLVNSARRTERNTLFREFTRGVGLRQGEGMGEGSCAAQHRGFVSFVYFSLRFRLGRLLGMLRSVRLGVGGYDACRWRAGHAGADTRTREEKGK